MAASDTAGIDVFRSASDALDRTLRHPRLREAAGLMEARRPAQAWNMLCDFLKSHPRDASALLLMAGVARQQGQNDDAELLLAKCLESRPGFTAARFNYASVLLENSKADMALAQADILLQLDPGNPLFKRLKADALEELGDFAGSMNLWRTLAGDHPLQPECWVRYGSTLRALGLQTDAIAAFRKALELDPSYSAGWVCLADLKTLRFDAADIEKMESQLARSGLSAEDRTHFHFSLGKAYADVKDFEKSFGHLAKGNAIRRVQLKHDPDVLTRYVARCKQVFTADLFRERAEYGCATKGPIFVVGMPRAGSTLVEQILTSHSQIEATKELRDIAALSREMQQDAAMRGDDYPEVIAHLDGAVFRSLGERYLEASRTHRKLRRPFFVDKMGANFGHAGLIQLMLPNAAIVDVRRHPMACCFSNFSQLFRKGQNNAYRLADLGRLYRDYVELMAHFDAVLPGKVYRVLYENLVADPDLEIRRLVEYLGLPFEEACLHFFNTDRAVATISAPQVRRPIYRDAVEHWQNYEPWLGSLKTVLGPVLDSYPEVPAFD